MITVPVPRIAIPENIWRGGIILLTSFVIALTAWCLSHGITIVFPNLYYILIIILAYHYRKKGFFLTLLVSLAYLVLVILFTQGLQPIEEAILRIIIFVIIAAMIAYLSESVVRSWDTVNSKSQIQQSIIQNANVLLMVIDQRGRIVEWNTAAEEITGYTVQEVMGKNDVWKYLYPDADYRKTITGTITRVIGENHFFENFETVIRTKSGAWKTLSWNTRAMPAEQGRTSGFVAIGIDITARKSAEEAILKSGQEWQTTFDAITDVVFLLDREGRIIRHNRAFEKFTGKTAQGIQGKYCFEILHGTNYPITGCPYEKAKASRKRESLELNIDNRWYNATVDPIFAEDGSISGAVHLIIDITERKRAEEALKESEARLDLALHSAEMGVWQWNVITDKRNFDDQTCHLLGLDSVTFSGSAEEFFAIVHPDDREILKKSLNHTVEQGVFYEPVYRVVWSDGSIHFITARGTLEKDAAGKPSQINGIIWDITERKQAEEQLRENQLQLANAMDLALIVNWEYDVATEEFRFDDRFYAFYGTTAEREEGHRMSAETYAREFVYPEDIPAVGGEIQKLLATKDPLYRGQMEHRIIRRGGEIRTIVARYAPVMDPQGKVIRTFGANQDITERKLTEEKLRESEEKFREIFSNINDAVQLHEIEPDGRPGKILDVNDAACRMLMISREELLTHNPLDFATEYHNPPIDEVTLQLRTRGMATFETGHRRTDGIIVPVEINAHVVKLMGKTVVLSVIRDLTYRKKAEEEIRLSNLILSTQQETSPDGILIVDESGKILSFNRRFTEIMGIPEDLITSPVDEPVLQFVVGQTADPEAFLARVRYLYDHKEEKSREEIVLKDRRVLERYSAPMVGKDNRYFGRVWYFHDITERKRAEEQIRESQQLFSDIISFLPDPTFVIDKDGRVLAWNRALELLSGVSADDIIGKGDHEYSIWLYGKRRPILIDMVLHPDEDSGRLGYTDIHWVRRTVTAQTETTRPGVEHKIVLSLVASPLIDPQGKVAGAIESMRDITRIKETEAELARINQNLEEIVKDRTRALEEEIAQRIHAENDVQEALSYTRSVIEANPDLMVVLDGKGTVLDVNATAESLTGVSREQLIGTQYLNYLVDDGTHRDALLRLLKSGKLENTIEIQRIDGHVTPLSVNATMIAGSAGTDARIIVAAHDITRQKQDEEAIRASLNEKVILLREIHHRVKNNLQIIISLVNLQLRQTDDPVLKQIMSETHNRVRAMSLVHEKLYRSESLSRIDFVDYTRFLATQLFSFFGMDSKRVRLDLAMGKIMVDINTAVPLGLIMNELISNALKHAFPNGRKGIISISGGENGDLITLVVRDNGIGIPEELDWKNTTTLGMRLVTSLIDQVGGAITLDRNQGTAFTITIKREPETGGTG
jgi:PAS domain S-box-containing protein